MQIVLNSRADIFQHCPYNENNNKPIIVLPYSIKELRLGKYFTVSSVNSYCLLRELTLLKSPPKNIDWLGLCQLRKLILKKTSFLRGPIRAIETKMNIFIPVSEIWTLGQ
jgi:hypothetical protein